MRKTLQTGYPHIDKPWQKYYSKEAIAGDLPSGSIYEYLYELNKEYLGDTALRYFGRNITYGELFEKINIYASALMQSGIGKGDIVSLAMLAMPETVYLFYAISKIGAVSNFIEINATGKQVADQVEKADSKVLFCVDIALEKVKKNINAQIITVVSVPIYHSMSFPIKVVAKIKSHTGISGGNVISLDDFISRSNGIQHEDMVQGTAEELAVIEYTGGTTGNPKGVMLSNQAVNSLARNYIYTDGALMLQRGHVFLDIIPPFLAYGLFLGIHTPLCVGCKLVLEPNPSPEHFPKVFLRSRPQHFSGGALHIQRLIENKKVQRLSLDFLITASYGGDSSNAIWEEKVSSFLHQHKCNYELLTGYGLTETAAPFCAKMHRTPYMIPFAKNNIRIVSLDSGEDLQYEQEGEVLLSGPTLMLGYYQNEKLTKETIIEIDGERWLKTGDIGYVTEEGYFFITGRIKRIYWKLGEDDVIFRVYPMEIERVICTHEEVDKCAVVGVKQGDRGYQTTAYLILRNDTEHYADQIINIIKTLCEKKLPRVSWPDEYKIVSEFPMTAAGKVNYQELEKSARKGTYA